MIATSDDGYEILMTDSEAAYLAGIVDGEGCISVALRSPSASSRENSIQVVTQIRVAMCNEAVVRWIHETTRVGTFSKEPRQSKGWRDIFAWRCSAHQGAAVIKRILPYMIVKREEAVLFLELYAIRRQSGHGEYAKKQYLPNRQAELVGMIQALKHPLGGQ